MKLTVACLKKLVCWGLWGGESRGSAFRSRHVICWDVPPDGLWATELRASRALIKLSDDTVWNSKLSLLTWRLPFLL
jgi:hypothetical protein